MKNLILILMLSSTTFAATNDAVTLPQPVPSLGESITNLILAISTLAGAITGIVGWLQSVRKGKALSSLIWAVETFKEKPGMNGNQDLKAHIESTSDKLGTSPILDKEVAKEVPKLPDVLKP